MTGSRHTPLQPDPESEQELAAREATAREFAVLRGDTVAIVSAVGIAVVESALHVSLVGLLAVLVASFVIVILRLRKARARTRRRILSGQVTSRDAGAHRHTPHTRVAGPVGRGPVSSLVAQKWLTMLPVYGGLGVYLVAEKAGMSGLGAFVVAVAAVVALIGMFAAVERVLGIDGQGDSGVTQESG